MYNTYCFPTAKIICERASMLRHTYTACFVYFYFRLQRRVICGEYSNTGTGFALITSVSAVSIISPVFHICSSTSNAI